MKTITISTLALAALTAVAGENEIAINATAQWESKYVSEGRDNLDDGGIATLETSAAWHDLSAGIWFADAYSDEYQELNLFAEYGLTFSIIDSYIGYTRLEFLDDHENDNEFSGGLALNNMRYLTPAVDYVYSTEAAGSFMELSLTSDIELSEEGLTLSPYILQGYDFGYASDEHDGRNHIQAGIEANYPLSEKLTLVGSLNHSWGDNDVDQDGGKDLTWGSLGLSAEF